MNIFFAVLLIFFAAFSRLIPHAPNFTPMISVALFAGVYLEKRLALAIPLLALLLSDVFLGFYGPLMAIVYGSTLLVSVFGFLMKGKVSIGRIAGTSFAGGRLLLCHNELRSLGTLGSGLSQNIRGLGRMLHRGNTVFQKHSRKYAYI